ncbi:MAG TPA: peptidoglycan bridge formation glycyltransferase FemA/FemB family protein [Myxococcota bacterium]|nr:peptidoglycan bridge formation glycyltransferase FemA/FemB family protein [Myxococcota bacterium]
MKVADASLEVTQKPLDHLVPTPIVQQTAFWGRVHRRLGFGASAFDLSAGGGEAGGVEHRSGASRVGGAGPCQAWGASDFLVVRAPLGADRECAYVPHGPELAPDPDDTGPFLERLSASLRPMLGERCAFIRWDLPWTSVHAPDEAEGDRWTGPPPPRVRELRLNFGTNEHNLRKAPRDLLPPSTMLVDLRKDEDGLLARMHPKTRYNIRLAARRGVVVTTGTLDDLPAWHSLYLETTARHHLEPMPLPHFEAFLRERADGTASPVKTVLLLARHQQRLVAGMLLALSQARAIYLYGASSHAHRELMGSHAMQWAAMRLAKSHGCLEYDLFGAAPRADQTHALAGVHRFKAGFGGRLVHREGTWDFPLDDEVYASWRTHEELAVQRRSIRAR